MIQHFKIKFFVVKVLYLGISLSVCAYQRRAKNGRSIRCVNKNEPKIKGKTLQTWLGFDLHWLSSAYLGDTYLVWEILLNIFTKSSKRMWDIHKLTNIHTAQQLRKTFLFMLCFIFFPRAFSFSNKCLAAIFEWIQFIQ